AAEQRHGLHGGEIGRMRKQPGQRGGDDHQAEHGGAGEQRALGTVGGVGGHRGLRVAVQTLRRVAYPMASPAGAGQDMEQGFDIVIVGGGLVGASLACALEGGGWRVAQVEATPRSATTAPPSFDERNLALARASVNALQALGVWRHLPSPPAPIRKVHVSSRGDFGTVRLDAADYRLESFGAVLPARELGAALEARLAELRDTTILRPARVVDLAQEPDGMRLTLEGEGAPPAVRARLLVAADGTRSALRARLGIGAREHDYAQTLFVATVALERPHADVA